MILLRSDENAGPFCSSLFVASNDFDHFHHQPTLRISLWLCCLPTAWKTIDDDVMSDDSMDDEGSSMMVCRFAVGVKAWWISLCCTNVYDATWSRSCVTERITRLFTVCTLCQCLENVCLSEFKWKAINSCFMSVCWLQTWTWTNDVPVSGWDIPGSTWTSQVDVLRAGMERASLNCSLFAVFPAAVLSMHQNCFMDVTVVSQQL